MLSELSCVKPIGSYPIKVVCQLIHHLNFASYKSKSFPMQKQKEASHDDSFFQVLVFKVIKDWYLSFPYAKIQQIFQFCNTLNYV